MIEIDKTLGVPAYRQIYKQIRSDIENGALEAGSLLPAIRDLAKEIGVARNTVEAAYRQLSLEGYATGKRGVGYSVEDLDFSVLDAVDGAYGEDGPEVELLPGLGMNPLGDNYGCAFDFCYGNRSVDTLPIAVWRTLANESLSGQDMSAAASYMDPSGLPDLRIRLAKLLTQSRDVVCTPEQIVLFPGTGPCIKNVVDLFPHDHLRVAMEDPGFNGARAAFASRRCDIVPIPTYMDSGIFLDFLNASKADLAFVTPSNQFPLGFIMPLAVRLQVIKWARENDAYIMEDDYCCEYHYDSDPVPSLQSLDPQHVIYLGTLSKILTPAMRLSYAVLPAPLVARWGEVNHGGFCQVPWLTQEILRRFIAKGYWGRYVRATVSLYRNRNKVLMDAIGARLQDKVDVLGAGAGLHILVGDRSGRGQRELIGLAREKDVRVYETDSYWMDRSHPMNRFVLVGYSSIADELIPEGIERLRQAWF